MNGTVASYWMRRKRAININRTENATFKHIYKLIPIFVDLPNVSEKHRMMRLSSFCALKANKLLIACFATECQSSALLGKFHLWGSVGATRIHDKSEFVAQTSTSQIS